jgi:hypothetical protein
MTVARFYALNGRAKIDDQKHSINKHQRGLTAKPALYRHKSEVSHGKKWI